MKTSPPRPGFLHPRCVLQWRADGNVRSNPWAMRGKVATNHLAIPEATSPADQSWRCHHGCNQGPSRNPIPKRQEIDTGHQQIYRMSTALPHR